MRRGVRAGTAAAVVFVVLAVVGCSYTKEEEPADGTAPTTAPSSTAPGEAAVTTITTAPPVIDLGAVAVELEEIAELDAPVAFAARAGDPSLYIAERGGEVRRIEITTRRSTGTTPTTTQTFELERAVTLDLSDEVTAGGEQGLLGLTFSTDGTRLYAAFTGLDQRQHLVEFTMEDEEADTGSRRDLLTIDDQFPNHNGGQLAFGPDGFLYWGMGDGGGGGDPERTGQDPSDLLGSILRIDPDVAPEERETIPYAIPNGNPFAAGGGAAEVWSYGLRNPWRFSFDRATGDLWIADVGQDQYEEIDLLLATDGTNAGRGANLGWSEMEGAEPFDGGSLPAGAVEPLFAYGRSDGGCSVTGGFVYRGERIPALVGVYVFADYCEGRLRGIVQVDGELRDQRDPRRRDRQPDELRTGRRRRAVRALGAGPGLPRAGDLGGPRLSP